MAGSHLGHKKEAESVSAFYEVLVPKQLAERWQVPESWIRQQTRSRCVDPIPHIRLGRYIRFSWGSLELNEWWQRRAYRGRNGSGRTT
jgi:hypothetical protein